MARRVLIYLAVMAGMTAFFGLFMLIFANSIELSCVRVAGQAPGCRITKSLLGIVPMSSQDVVAITDVQVDENCDDGCSYRAVLVTAGGEGIPLNDVYTDQGPVMRQVDAVSGFLNSSDAAFEYREPVPWWVVVLVLGMDLTGTVVVAGIFLRQSAAA